MSWQLLISGLVLGAISSFHCVGMCGGIAFSLPVHHKNSVQKTIAVLLYNVGRITTYALLGLLFGLAGRSIYIGGIQQWFSISAGIILLIVALATVFQQRTIQFQLLRKPLLLLQSFIAKRINNPKKSDLFLVGVANGLLPCGMVYVAVTGAMAAGTVSGGVVFMTAFGFGTFPLMMALSYFGFMVSLGLRNNIKKAIPYAMAIMALLLIVRGAGLGIPYLSPWIQNNTAEIIRCH